MKSEILKKVWDLNKKIVSHLKRLFILLIHFSGIEFIYRKFIPSKNDDSLPTGFIWLFGIYITLFGIAFNNYESRKAEINNLANNLTAQLLTEHKAFALSRIPDIQWQPCPLKPIVYNPISVFSSLFGADHQYLEVVDLLKDIIIENRNSLNSKNLGYCDLRGMLFLGGNFENGMMIYSKADQSIFVGVNFKNTDFFNARFNYAWFNKCNFEGANLLSVNFEGVFFSECNLESAKGINLVQLLKCRSLYKCKLKPNWEKVLKRDYPHKLEWPDGVSLDKMAILKNRTLPSYFEKISSEHSSD